MSKQLPPGEGTAELLRFGRRYGISPREVLSHYIRSPLFVSMEPGRNKLDAFLINFSSHKKWLAFPTQKIGPFSLEPGPLVHTEAPHALIVNDESGRLIATAGFHVRRSAGNPKETEMVISNVQGVRGKAAALERLSAAAGESWRPLLVKRLRAFAEEHGLGVVGEAPLDYVPVVRGGKGERLRLERQYAQTFRKAGFVRRGGEWRLP